MKPQDVVILLRLLMIQDPGMTQRDLAIDLFISQAEVSHSLNRCRYAGLLGAGRNEVMKRTFLDFLQYGLAVVFPTRPGPITRGVPTAHSTSPLSLDIQSNEIYIWPWAKGSVRGMGISPLYPTLPQVAASDPDFHEWLALVDALRVGKAREGQIALDHLKKRII